jgi:predicted deacylase
MNHLKKYEFLGKKEGIYLLVTAAVHGNETAGTKAIDRLSEVFAKGELSIESGRLTLVPICNPQAYQKNVRQIDENLNRVLTEHPLPRTYEQQLANELCPLIKTHDVLLDLHSTHCEGDVPFAFCDYPDEINCKIISGFPISYVLEGWPKIYEQQGEIADYCSERAAHLYGHSATTLECGYHKSEEAVGVAYQAILNTLSLLQMVSGREVGQTDKTYITLQSYAIKKRAGVLAKPYKHLTPVVKGEVLARYDDGEELKSPLDGYILLPNHTAEIGAEWYYLGTVSQ